MNKQANKGAAFTPTHTALITARPISGISSPLIEAVERFGVMKCTSSGQSLIHAEEQESKPSVAFPLTLNTPFQFIQ